MATRGAGEVAVHGDRGIGMLEVQEMHQALFAGKPIAHDGRWALATAEVGAALVESSRTRREITLAHQCALRS